MERFVSAFGLVAMIGFAYLMSSNHKKFPLRVVVGGLALQLLFALLILQTAPGKTTFRVIGDVFTNMISHVDAGSRFMFGMKRELEVPVVVSGKTHQTHFSVWENSESDKQYIDRLVDSIRGKQGKIAIAIGKNSQEFDLTSEDWEQQLRAWFHVAIGSFRNGEYPQTKQLLSSFAFGVLPTIIFFSALMSMLYYLGIMQKVVAFFAWIMRKYFGNERCRNAFRSCKCVCRPDRSALGDPSLRIKNDPVRVNGGDGRWICHHCRWGARRVCQLWHRCRPFGDRFGHLCPGSTA